MGKAALLAVAAFAVYGSVHASGMLQGRQDLAVREAETEYRLLARQSARAGLALAQQGLAEDFASATHAGSFDGVDYRADVQVTVDTAIVRSAATVAGPHGRPVSFTISARYERLGVGSDGQPAPMPGFFENLLFVDQDFSIGGSSQIYPVPPLTGNDLRFHTNRNYSVGNGGDPQGRVTYSGTKSGSGLDGTERWAPPIPYPAVVPDQIVAMYGGADRVFNSSATGSGTFIGGPREDPTVYHIKGNLSLHDLTVTGYAVFVVNGSISVSGRFSGTNPSGRNESTLALYTPGSISLSGNTVLDAQIVAGGSLSYNGNVEIRGTLAVKNALHLSGTATIRYRPASPTISRGIGERVLVRAAYSEY